MPNKDIFCNIPWYELHINHDGSYDLCGCMSELITQTDAGQEWNIRNYPVAEYWQSRRLRDERLQKMSDTPNPACGVCQHQDSLGSHSKRIKENLKSVLFYDRNFYKSFEQSPHRAAFEYSARNDGATITTPVSYHLSLGNECDLACVMCSPNSSYKLAADYKALGWIKDSRRLNWTDDQAVWDSFCETLLATDLVSLHIIGGEPTINKRFHQLIDLFVANNRTDFSFSFTTNGMHNIDHLWYKLARFKRVEIGMSVETVNKANDYVRYGSSIDTILSNITHFKDRAPDNVAFVIRTVPTLLTINYYSQLIDWCLDNNFLIDSYFATDPAWQQIRLLPDSVKIHLQTEFQIQLDRYTTLSKSRITGLTNFRNQSHVLENLMSEVQAAIASVALGNQDPDLTAQSVLKFKQLDTMRGNSVVENFPMLTQYFESNGY
jgi:MoaA/NifB/PqqE/SkfB family radical SAM enzyme